MSKQVLILGAGTAGTTLANRLARAAPRGWKIAIVDRDDVHIYQPGLLFIPFGIYQPNEIVRPRMDFLDPSVERVLGEVHEIDLDGRSVALADGRALRWDLLVVATGARPAYEALPGLTGVGWHTTQTDFYSIDGALAARDALGRMRGGRLVVHLHDLPITCPVAPLEFAFLAEAALSARGLRSDVEITFVTPLDAAFTKPVAARVLGGMLAARGIDVVTDFGAERVDGARRQLISYDGRTVDYDLLVSTPVHQGDAAVGRSGMGDELGFLPIDPRTLQSKLHPDVFALGDGTNAPTSKAGSVAHFQSEVLTDNVLRHMDGRALLAGFDGHAQCFVETGHDKALLIDFSYDVEPLPGRYPLPGVGPFTLLEESHANHWGKLGFKWVYWSQLLRGKDLPVPHGLDLAGKWSA